MTHLGIVTGLAAEARCLHKAAGGDALTVVCSGGDAARALSAARTLIANGADSLLSFGLAGGLDPTLAPGTAVIADAVIDPGGARLEVDADWRDALLALFPWEPPLRATIAGRDQAVASIAAKRALRAESGAVAVDMESHAVAGAAAEAGLPFAAIRAVADPADRAVPRAALAGLGPEGETRPWAVLGEIVLRPWELPALIAIAGDARRALAKLERCAAFGAPLFGRGDLG